MPTHRVEERFGDRTLTIETGRMARQADGAALVQIADTVVLAAAVSAPSERDVDFFPLTVDYREKASAAGKFPGGFFKREGRPTTKETLTSRLIDRPIRPMFPAGYRDEVQVQAMVLSADQRHDPDVLAGIAASASLVLSRIPFKKPLGFVRVALVDGNYVLFPTHEETERSKLDLIVVGAGDLFTMVEGGAREASEEEVAGALRFAEEPIRKIIALQERLLAEVRPTVTFTPPPPVPAKVVDRVRKHAAAALRGNMQIKDKRARADATHAHHAAVLKELAPEGTPEDEANAVRAALEIVEEEVFRSITLSGTRVDGRGYSEIRPISCEVSILPRTHGSCLFTRGETQALCITTLGAGDDEQLIEGLEKDRHERFMLHYAFPSFSVGEIKPIRGPGRREIGHGALAKRALESVLPPGEQFAYTVRIVADILESNGSSSMATVCGGTLALMDAGVPIRRPVAGISIGLVKDGDRHVLLTDIQGAEDHLGDMDFKIAGSQRGITAIQLDIKLQGVERAILEEALGRAREARIEILKTMLKAMPRPRAKISDFAPQLLLVRVPPGKVGRVIGSGGKTIKKLQADTQTTIEVKDDPEGDILVSSFVPGGAQRAKEIIEGMCAEAEVGKIYRGTVTSIKDFGCFVEILPGQEGLVHVSELDANYVERVDDVVSMGDVIDVKCIGVDDMGKIRLSRKAMMQEKVGG